MASAGVGLSNDADPSVAAGQAAREALRTCPAPTACLAFASPGYGPELPRILDVLCSELSTECVVGATAHGVVGNGREHEGDRGVSLLAFGELEAHPVLIPDPSREEVALELAAHLDGPRPEDLVVLLPDPGALRADALLVGIDRWLAPATVVGAGAVDGLAGPARQWCGRELVSGGLAALALRAATPPRVGVTQACRPASGLMTITKTQGNWIVEIDGSPALDVYREVVRGPLAGDLRRAAAYVLVAFPRSAEEPLAPGGYVVRHVVGFAEAENALAVPEPIAPGAVIAFVKRDPETAREDLKDMLARTAGGGGASCGLWLDCCARGKAFFGVPGLEAAYLESALGPIPVAGMFGSCEIGPVAGRTELLTYTGVLTLIDA